MAKALVIDPRDNVAVALTEIKAGEKVSVKVGERQIEVTARSNIPFGHKLAVRKIAKGGEVVKYGEVIGKATADIEVGEHVHVHNVESLTSRKRAPNASSEMSNLPENFAEKSPGKRLSRRRPASGN